MNIADFQALYVSELQELRSVEDQLVNALPGLGDLAASPALKQLLASHLEATRLERDRLDGVLQSQGVDERAHHDSSVRVLLDEATRWAGMIATPELRDAALIASVQRIEHYKIAVYGTLATWAKTLGHKEDLNVFLAFLEEEKGADAMMTELAKRLVNPEAAQV
jgi:ferritin-like metal-binding protein YciE